MKHLIFAVLLLLSACGGGNSGADWHQSTPSNNGNDGGYKTDPYQPPTVVPAKK